MSSYGRVALTTHWVVIGLFLAIAATSVETNFLVPIMEVRRMLGELPEGFRIESTYRVAGLATWDASITDNAATELRKRCGSAARLFTGERVNELRPGDQPIPEPESAPLRGCVLAKEGDKRLQYERVVLLEGRTLQLALILD